MTSLICDETKIRVSSVLNRDVKQFGKKFMFDEDVETCWNSDHGSPQWCQLEFPKPVDLHTMHLKFQGGFVGKECTVEDIGGEGTQTLATFYPDDINSLQIFQMPNGCTAQKVRITFVNSTDFFGRITIYKLDLL